MGITELRSALPEYAADLRLNLDAVVDRSRLTPQRLWGTLLVSAVAARSPRVLRELGPEARSHLSPEAYTAALSTSAVMAMNNVFHRTRHLLSDPEYGRLRTGLRAGVLRDPGIERLDVELWSVAVSAVNGCGACLDAHERVLREAGVDRETVQEAFRIAAVVQAVGTTLDAEEILAP